MLAAGSFTLQIHNENSIPLLSAECKFDPQLTSDIIGIVPAEFCSEEQGFQLRQRANDAVEQFLDGNADPSIKASCTLPLVFDKVEIFRIHVVGSGDISLNDPNEGNELERLTFQAFDSLFPFGVFRNPSVGEGKKRRELCDVLAVSRIREVDNEGIFVIQNKVASAFSEGLKRETDRRARSIQKNIMVGIRQLEGAIKTLLAGETIYRATDGTPVEVDPPELDGQVEPLNLRERATQVGQGIVLISDMHHKVDWKAVFFALSKVFMSTRYFCHVLDLKELTRLITHSKGRPAFLEGLLLLRGKEMLKNKTALVRSYFLGGKY